MQPVEQWTILVIDNEPDNIGVIEFTLKFYKVRVLTALSGAAGLTILQNEYPTAVLLDIQMPEMTGWEVLQHIRDSEPLRGLPVIALTAKAMTGDREKILSGGFNGYISKPISAVDLVRTIQEILNKKIEQ